MNNEQVRVLNEALIEVAGCFEAAQAEGLEEALMNATDDRLRDLVERRLMYAFRAAQPFTPRVFRDGDAICAVWPDFIDLQTSPAGFGDTKEDAIRNLIATSAAPDASTAADAGVLPLKLVDIVSSGHDGWANLIYTGDDCPGAPVAMLPPFFVPLFRRILAAPERSGKLADNQCQKCGAWFCSAHPPADSSSAAPSVRVLDDMIRAPFCPEDFGLTGENAERAKHYAEALIRHRAAPSPARESLDIEQCFALAKQKQATGESLSTEPDEAEEMMRRICQHFGWRTDGKGALLADRIRHHIKTMKGCIKAHESVLADRDAELAQVKANSDDISAHLGAMTKTATELRATLATPRQTEDGSGLSAAIDRGADGDWLWSRFMTLCKKHGVNEGGPLGNDLFGIVSDLRGLAPKETAVQGGVPEGWQLVPKEPTQEMIENTAAFDLEGEDDANNAYRIIYCAMLAASPAPTGASK